MLATLCSKPIATKAAIGKAIPITLPIKSLAAKDNQTARQTNQLARIPRMNDSRKDKFTLVTAVSKAEAPTKLPFNFQYPET